MNEKLYKLLFRFIKLISYDTIVNKAIDGFNKKIYYERSQHLTFLFQRKVNYEINIWNNIKEYLNPNDLVFDIGGNIGQYALRFSEKVGKNGRVISFEPDFKNFAFLQFNTSINACKNVECLNMGLGESPETITFFRDTETGGRMGSFIKEFVHDNFRGFTDLVMVDTFDHMIKIYGEPDFVKIDVEGFELNVLKGIKNYFKNKILIETERIQRKLMFFEFFSTKDYECYCVDNKEIFEISDKSLIPSFANLLFIHA